MSAKRLPFVRDALRKSRAFTMPKEKLPPLPTSGLFGIVKPSGPSSMSVINDLKRLVSTSKIFMPPHIAKRNSKELFRKESEVDDAALGVDKKTGREKGKWKKAKGKARELEAKMGQGGTLDPLADGVLGALCACKVL